MKANITKAITAMTAVAMTLSVSMTALASGTDGSYGYQIGQSENSNRRAQFQELSGLTSDEEREAFFKDKGIGGNGPHSGGQHLDAEELVAAGLIDQETADLIMAAASEKHEKLRSGYSGVSEMTMEERQAFYEGRSSGEGKKDSVSDLVERGILTQEQADAIAEYLSLQVENGQ